MDRFEEFLEHWRGTNEDDSARRLFDAVERKFSEVDDLRVRSLTFLRPAKAEDGYVPSYDPEALPTLDRFGVVLAEFKAMMKEVNKFVKIVGGPTLHPIHSEVSTLQNRIRLAVIGAERARRQAEGRHHGASLVEICEDPEVVEAEELLAATRKECDHRLGELQSQITDAMALINKYDV